MTAHRTILLADTPPRAEARLRTLLPEVDFRPVPLAAAHDRAGDAAAAVVWVNGNAEAAFRAVGALDTGGLRVIVVGERKDADLILRAMREGAKEFVVSDDELGLVRALRQQVRTAGAQGGAVHAVFAAKGGVGATTLATNLAGALQARGTQTCLVDLNVAMGDVLAFLDLTGGYSLSELVKNLGRLDPALLETSLLRHGSGIRVLAQSQRLDEAERLDGAVVGAALGFLRPHFGAVVVDGLRSFDELALAALDASDRILLVVTQEIPAVRDARRCVDLLRRLGCEDKITVVVNRHRKGLQIDDAVVADTIGLPVAALVANDYPAVIQAVNRGALLANEAPRAQVTRDVAGLAAMLAPADGAGTVAAAPARAGLLGRLLHGRGRDAARG